MSDAFLSLTSYVVNAVWQVPLIGATGWVLSQWLKKMGPERQHRIWVAVLILATFTPCTPLLLPLLMHPTPSSIASVSSQPIFASRTRGDVSPANSPITIPPVAIYLVSSLYIACLLFFSFRLYLAFRRTSALARNARRVSLEPDSMAMWSTSKKRFSAEGALLLYSGEVPGPMTAGFVRPVLLLPAGFVEKHSEREFLAAVGHECAHIQRDDFRKNVLYEAVALFTSFHPLIWFIKSQIAQTREMICDRMAAERLLDRHSYGESLLQLASKMVPVAPSTIPYTVGMFDTNALERRIMTLMTSVPRISQFRRYSFGVTATLVLLGCAGVTGLFTQTVSAQASKAPQVGSKENKRSVPDLSCTYYNNRDVAFPGTCNRDKLIKTKYLCTSNADQSKSQFQTGCEWKVQRAEAAEAEQRMKARNN